MLLRYFRRLGWLGALAAVLVVAAAILTAVKSFIGGGVLLAVAIVILTLAPKALKWLEDVRKEEKSLLRINRPISKVDPFEERFVFKSALAEQDYESGEPAYIPRDVDSSLREALRTKHFVLLTGRSTSGKSRTAFEAARSMEPEPTLIVPGSPEALPKLLELGLPVDRSRPTVLWLDNLERYLQGSGVSPIVFEDLGKQESRVVVLATITLTANDQLHSGEEEIGYSVREILDLFEEVYLPDVNSPSELEEAQRLYPSQHFAAGIGEHFAAAHELLGKFKRSLESNPHGFAVVVAALDWRRAGMSRAITEEELRELYPLCLEHFHPLLEPSDETYKDGLDWARTPLRSRAALLVPVHAAEERVRGLQIFDYVRDWADGTGSDVDPRLQRVLDSAWPFVIGRAEPAEALAIGLAAHTRGEPHFAENAWRKVGGSGEPNLAPIAAFNLGLLLRKRDPQEAEAAFQQAVDSDSDIAPMAARNLGLLLYQVYKQDRAQEAVEAFQQAIDSRDHHQAPMAALNLGRVLKELGRPQEAEDVYRKAIELEHSDFSPRAALRLGELLEEQDRAQEAVEAFQQAIDSRHSNYAPQAAIALGRVLEDAPQVAVALGRLLEEQGRSREAEEVYKWAVHSGASEEVVHAAEQALQRLHTHGDG